MYIVPIWLKDILADEFLRSLSYAHLIHTHTHKGNTKYKYIFIEIALKCVAQFANGDRKKKVFQSEPSRFCTSNNDEIMIVDRKRTAACIYTKKKSSQQHPPVPP